MYKTTVILHHRRHPPLHHPLTRFLFAQSARQHNTHLYFLVLPPCRSKQQITLQRRRDNIFGWKKTLLTSSVWNWHWSHQEVDFLIVCGKWVKRARAFFLVCVCVCVFPHWLIFQIRKRETQVRKRCNFRAPGACVFTGFRFFFFLLFIFMFKSYTNHDVYPQMCVEFAVTFG